MTLVKITRVEENEGIVRLPYILAYKPAIFGSILTFKLWGSAYTRVMPYSQESTGSTTAICQRRSLCVSHTRRGPLVGH